MSEQAFETLGISPTTDGRVIRAAFVRLARIYHPDRFVGMPQDVRAEAERRMKEATVAYEQLREARKSHKVSVSPAISDSELQERARRYRELMDANRQAEESDRARWRRWDEVERQAREKQEINAQIESMIRGDGIARPAPSPKAPAPSPSPATKGGSLFEKRIDAARRGEVAPLVPQAEATG